MIDANPAQTTDQSILMELVMRPFVILSLGLAACGGASATAAPEPPAAAPAAVVAAPAPAGTAEAVGPDGPAALAVPAVAISEDPALVAQGKAVFDAKGCGGCHKFGAKLVGPDLKGVTVRRSPTWIARMVKYPEKMTKQDPVAKDLFRQTMVQMTDQGVPEADLQALISYLNAEGK